jgi:hypothetical protein
MDVRSLVFLLDSKIRQSTVSTIPLVSKDWPVPVMQGLSFALIHKTRAG